MNAPDVRVGVHRPDASAGRAVKWVSIGDLCIDSRRPDLCITALAVRHDVADNDFSVAEITIRVGCGSYATVDIEDNT